MSKQECNETTINEIDIIEIPRELAEDIYNSLVCFRRLKEYNYEQSKYNKDEVKYIEDLYFKLDEYMK